MRRLVIILAAAATLSPALVSAQTLTPDQQIRRNERNLRVQQQRDKAAARHQAHRSRALDEKTQADLANLQAQGAKGPVNTGLVPTGPLYGSSSAAARGAATANSVPASATVPDVVGGPLNLPGPTNPAVGAYTPASPAGHEPAAPTAH